PSRASGGSLFQLLHMCRRRSPFTPICRLAMPLCAIPRAFISALRSLSFHIWAPRGWSPRCRLRQEILVSYLRSILHRLVLWGLWWNALEFDAAPKIIARLPFVERRDHPAALPVYVICRVAADAMAMEAAVWSVRVSGWGAGPAQALTELAEFIAVPDRAFDGA